MVVVDSSALIPLARTGRLNLIRKAFEKAKTTREVYKETVEQGKGKQGTSELKTAFDTWLQIEKTDEEGAEEVSQLEGIEKADAGIILLAEKESEKLLANDRALIQVARSRNVNCYWLTTLLLKCIKEEIINKGEGKDILYELVKEGMNLQNRVYARILKEIEKLETGRNK